MTRMSRISQTDAPREPNFGARAILLFFIFALILAPFFLWGDAMERWTIRALEEARRHRAQAAGLVAGLLATDILLPIPSSMVSTAGGVLLGVAAGTAASWIGMTISCLLGYELGRSGGRWTARRLMGRREKEWLEARRPRAGVWILALTRPIPVLAEAAVLVAGIGRMPRGIFWLAVSLSNFGISLAYAAVGAWSAGKHSFLYAFLAACAFPALGLLVKKLGSHRLSGRHARSALMAGLAGIALLSASCATAPPPRAPDPVDKTWETIVRKMENRHEVRIIGTVATVNRRDGFAILQCRVLPKAGQEVKVYSRGAMSALLKIGSARDFPYVCADILAGEPARGDIVKEKGWIP